jgi:hypothetical protein
MSYPLKGTASSACSAPAVAPVLEAAAAASVAIPPLLSRGSRAAASVVEPGRVSVAPGTSNVAETTLADAASDSWQGPLASSSAAVGVRGLVLGDLGFASSAGSLEGL